MRVRRLDIARPFAAGRAAGLAGKDVHAMPYDETTTDPLMWVRIQAWLRGWRLAQR